MEYTVHSIPIWIYYTKKQMEIQPGLLSCIETSFPNRRHLHHSTFAAWRMIFFEFNKHDFVVTRIARNTGEQVFDQIGENPSTSR